MSEPGRALGGKVALVTGASRGIGAATARALAGAGARVILVARRADLLGLVAEELGPSAVPIAADLTKADAISTVGEAVAALFTDGVDIIVHAAGVFSLAPVDESREQDLDLAFSLNAAAPLRLTQSFLPGMRARGRGHIVSVGSLADRVVLPGNAVYAASKHAVRAIHEALRLETRGSGVRATLVSPAATDTPLWDPHHPDETEHLPSRSDMLRPEDVADAVLWAVTRPAHVDVDEVRLSRS